MLYTFNNNLSGELSISSVDQWSILYKNKNLKSYVIVLNFGDSLQLEVDSSILNIPKNGMSFLNPGSYWNSVKALDDKHYFIAFNSAFYCLELHDKEISCNGLLFGATPEIPLLHSSTQEAEENLAITKMLIQEFEHNDSTQGDMLRLLLKRLIIMCVRIGRSQLFKDFEPKLEDTDLIRNFQALVEKHFKEKHKVADYAELLFKSPKTLSNAFHLLGDKTPLQIIQERIVLEAKRFLQYTNKNIKEITYDLGFSEPAQFSRLFKKLSGLSPSEFQAKQNQDKIPHLS